jgi:hypothetical protein
LKAKHVFKWREIQETAFLKVKQALREAGNLKSPEYDKKFVLKTDASNTGLGAVLIITKVNWFQYNGPVRNLQQQKKDTP